MLQALLFFGTTKATSGVWHSEVFGHRNCPCTLNNDLIPEGTRVKHIGYGIDCRAWDQELAYCVDELNADRESGYNEGFEWCANSWCYVDPEECDGPVLVDEVEWHPSDSDRLFYPSVVWPGTRLHYSYQTCGNEDNYSDRDIEWNWDFTKCLPRTPNDYYMLVDGSESVSDEWNDMKIAMKRIVEHGMHMDGDRVGMIEFSGHRDHRIDNHAHVFDFSASRSDAMAAIDNMENLRGQTWTLHGLQETVKQWNTETPLADEDRNRILLLVTDGRPKPRLSKPGCLTQLNNPTLPVCRNGRRSTSCRNRHCADDDVDMETTDCCPGDQDPCSSDQSEALVQSLKDSDIMVVVIAVGNDASNIKNDQGEVLYFQCLLTPGYDQTQAPVAHRIATISDFAQFFEYKDPTATVEGGNDGELCIDPVVFLPPAPPTPACTEMPEPKSVVLTLDSSKSMYTTKNRGGTYTENWLSIMQDLESVVCLHNNLAAVEDTCAYTARDNVGLVAFASRVEEIHHVTSDSWFTNLRFTREDIEGNTVANINPNNLRFMTDTVAGLWSALDQMKEEPFKTFVDMDNNVQPVRREVILITDGRPHCRRDDETLCQPCSDLWRDETLQKMQDADAKIKMVWRGDRLLHDGSIDVDVDFLKRADVFGCLDIDFDSPSDFVAIENFADPEFVRALRGQNTCIQMQPLSESSDE